MADRGDSSSDDDDPIQQNLDQVSRILASPTFLRANISPSRLPSNAVTAGPLSPGSARSSAELAPVGRFPHGDAAADQPPPPPPPPPAQAQAQAQADDPRKDSIWHKDGALKAQKEQGHGKAAAQHGVGRLNAQPSRFLAWLRTLFVRWDALATQFEAGLPRPQQQLKPLSTLANYSAVAMANPAAVPAAAAAGGSAPASFQTFDVGHDDLVLAVDFDFTGTRMVTASSDQRLKVWDKLAATPTWQPVDTWRAHDAEIVDVKFNGPFSIPSLASVAEDSRLKLWAEDPLAAPNSASRFKCIWSQRSETGVPFCSLSFKYLQNETYLAAVTRDGYLAIYEPLDFDDLSGDWGRIHGEHVCPTPSPAEETGFRVDWHKEKLPCWAALDAGLDRRSLSLAVAAMHEVKILRTDKDRCFYVAATITGSKAIVRDLAWSNGAMRGYDLIAAASKDGAVRIYELTTPKAGATAPAQGPNTITQPPQQQQQQQQPGLSHHAESTVPTILEPGSSSFGANAPSSPAAPSASSARFSRGGGFGNRGAASAASGIASGLSVSRPNTSLSPAAAPFDPSDPSSAAAVAATSAPAGRVMQVAKLVAEVGREHGNVWRVAWSFAGDLLLTTGDDGAVRAWKRSGAAEWLEAAAVDVEGA